MRRSRRSAFLTQSNGAEGKGCFRSPLLAATLGANDLAKAVTAALATEALLASLLIDAVMKEMNASSRDTLSLFLRRGLSSLGQPSE